MLLEFYLLVNFMARNRRKLEKLDKKKFQTPFAKELRSTLSSPLGPPSIFNLLPIKDNLGITIRLLNRIAKANSNILIKIMNHIKRYMT